MTNTSNMPARIWADLNSPAWSRSLDAVSGFDSAMPYYRADIVERMADEFAATNQFLSLFSNGLDLDEYDTAINFIFRDKITGEVIRREEVTLNIILERAAAALNSYREASNDQA